ncbi:MAG: N-acetylmuramoyl-L-alanine amidase [Pseudomonadota bacterium]
MTKALDMQLPFASWRYFRLCLAAFAAVGWSSFAFAAEQTLRIDTIVLRSSPEGFSIVLQPAPGQASFAQASRSPELDIQVLSSPDRVVLDLDNLEFAPDTKVRTKAMGGAEARGAGAVSGIQFGADTGGGARLIVGLAQPALPFPLPEETGPNGTSFVLGLDPISRVEYQIAVERSLAERRERTLDAQIPQPEAENGDFIVVIDPGHGGIDGGAVAKNGRVVEKNLTLSVARQVKAALEDMPGFEVHLTRDGDEFLRLSRRVAIARARNADLMLSIHADSLRQTDVRGATIYTLSRKASDEVSAALAEAENRADLTAGFELEQDDERVTDILIDLARLETKGFSRQYASKLLNTLKGEVRLINNPMRSAGFRVLKAPDVPSVLLEMGYLSNARDAEMLSDPAWQADKAQLLARSIAAYRDSHAPAQTGSTQ